MAEKEPERGLVTNEYSTKYSENSFWEKVKGFAIKAGREVIEKALILYYCLQDPNTPRWAKASIIAALGYFICLIDAIPDLTPGIGFADDLGVLVAAFSTVAQHVREEHKEKAREKLAIWFG